MDYYLLWAFLKPTLNELRTDKSSLLVLLFGSKDKGSEMNKVFESLKLLIGVCGWLLS